MWCCQLCGWCLCPWLRRWAPQWSESWCLNRCGVLCLATMGRSQMCQWGISPRWKWCCMFSFSWGKMTCQCMYFGVSYFQTRQSWLWDVMTWVNMVRRPTDCGEFISIPHYEPSHSMWLGPILIDFHMIFRWFQIPNHSRMIPKKESQMPRGSQVALALAQLSGKQQAQLRELKVELCAQGGSSRHFHVEHREKQHFCSFFP